MSADSASVLAWREELGALEVRLGELFVRAEPRRQAGLYLEGLLSAAKRKNGWQLAEQIGDARPWRTQRVLSHGLWDQDAARDLCRDYVIEHLWAADGVLIVDETGFLEKGEHLVGVRRQYSAAFQTRPPPLMRQEGLASIDPANRWLATVYIPHHNARFAVAPAEEGTAFVPFVGAFEDILCVQDERVVGNDNTVRYAGRVLQIPEQRHRR